MCSTTGTLHSSIMYCYLISGRVPAEWKDGIIVSLYKGKVEFKFLIIPESVQSSLKTVYGLGCSYNSYNTIPEEIKSLNKLNSFKKHLKSHLFNDIKY